MFSGASLSIHNVYEIEEFVDSEWARPSVDYV